MIYENLGAFASRILCFSSFIDTTQCFPQPLSKEEELECLKKAKKGDKKARDKLITHNLRLVAHIVKKYPRSLEADDLISVGTIGLIKAIDSFDYEKGTKLSTYASRCIENEILMLIRANKRHKDVISLNSICGNIHDDNDLELEQSIQLEERKDVLEQVEETYLVDKVRRAMEKKLSPMEQQVIAKRYALDGGDCKTQREVAQELGISRSYISRIETKAMAILKEDLRPPDDEQV